MIERGQRFDLHHGGFIQVVDWMGDDAAIVQAARVSYGEGTKTVREDRGLIRYLMRHWHTTPFEMCELKLLVKVPMDTWRQWIRHRTASVNEYSTRYSLAIDEAATTPPGEWRLQSTVNKQGSAGRLEEYPEGFRNLGHEMVSRLFGHEAVAGSALLAGEYLSGRERGLLDTARDVYEERLAFGVAREQARKDLPLSTFTQAYWKCDLHNLLHFLRLRMDSHAQSEIREYADIIGNDIVAELWPLTWEALVDYRLKARSFSRMEVEVLKGIVRLSDNDDSGIADSARSAGMSDREVREFLEALGCSR